jgi:hypothetical protein
MEEHKEDGRGHPTDETLLAISYLCDDLKIVDQ